MDIVYSNNKKVLNSVTGISGQFIVPESVEKIDSTAFQDCDGLSSVIIPSSVKEIECGAFRGCSSLKEFLVDDDNTKYKSVDGVMYSKDMSVIVAYPPNNDLEHLDIPDSVRKICDYAFYGCGSIKEVLIESVEYIGESAFENCNNLKTLLICSGTLTEIKPRTFANCVNLNLFDFPKSLEMIGSEAFECCHSLDHVSIPDSVTIIESNAFCNCSRLRSISISESVTKIGMFAFVGCSNLRDVYIKDSVDLEVISHGAFADCVSLSDIKIPASVTFIGSIAFKNCKGLTDVFCDIENLEELRYNDDVFEGCDFDNCILNVPNGKVAEYREHLLFSQFDTILNEDEENELEDEADEEDENVANELFLLAAAYYEGIIFPKDYEIAFECYKNAALLGHEVAQCDLAFMYRMGQGTEMDMEQAVYWYKNSAWQGFSDAQLELGVLYHNGDGVERDYKKSLYWYKKSAKQGNDKALENLNRMLNNEEISKEDVISEDSSYRVGDDVKVIDGPFVGHIGMIEEIDADKNKLKVLVWILGKETLFEFKYEQVCKNYE